MRRAIFFLLILTHPIANPAIGQEAHLDAEQLAWYQRTLPLFQEAVSGGQYADAPAGYLGSPYYESQQFDFGVIWINGLRYPKVQLRYDAWQDEVLVVHPLYNQMVQIKAAKVEKFVFANGVVFLNIENNPGYSRHKRGFYQVVAVGEPMLLKKHYRSIESVKEPGLITREFKPGQDFFFWFQGKFWQVGSKSAAMAGLGLSKKEVAGHFKGMKQSFKHDPETYLKELLRLREEKPEPFQSFPSR